EGKPVSFGTPLVVRLADGVTFRVSHLQKGDLDELASFHKKPTEAWVRGEITRIDAATRTVYIKAVSVSFGQ
ncbi:MAG TPA: hypothetical protein VG733_09100, partial [Chthoniobacteraceae bacterium]|nr:hypothetical protein [Chthoniobacteraceae bacterium]